ncbi:MAG: acyltransferase [Bacteroidia bacterium]|nr:acyltransferase [Bacteroidia bacterium]
MGKNNFDFLRFAFALIVVLSHTVDLSLAPSIQFLKPYLDTHVSVTGFFVISGCLISASYIRSSSLRSYLEKRARRLLPAYILIVVLAVVIFSGFSTLSLTNYFTSKQLYSYLLSNLFFLNFIQPCLPGVFEANNLCAVNGALWTIKVEVGFYLVLPVIIWGLNRTKKKWLFLAILYLFGLGYYYGISYLSHVMPHKQGLLYTLKNQLPGYLTYFSAGILLFQYLDFVKKNITLLSTIALPVFVIEYMYGLEVFLPLAMTILIAAIAFGFSFLNNFGKYGDVSYGIYIFHFPFIQALISLGFFNRFEPMLVLVMLVLFVLLLGFLSWHLLEKRFIKRSFSA